MFLGGFDDVIFEPGRNRKIDPLNFDDNIFTHLPSQIQVSRSKIADFSDENLQTDKPLATQLTP